MNRDCSHSAQIAQSSEPPLCSVEHQTMGRRSSTGNIKTLEQGPSSTRRGSLLVDYSKNRANEASPKESSKLSLSSKSHHSLGRLGSSSNHHRRPRRGSYQIEKPQERQPLNLFERKKSFKRESRRTQSFKKWLRSSAKFWVDHNKQTTSKGTLIGFTTKRH